MRKPLIIINDVAAKARHLWPIIRANLEQRNLEYDAYKTRSAGDATNQTRLALKAGTDVIAVVGGDGTLSEAAAGFFDLNSDIPSQVNPQAALAILPAGTGDDFARGLRGKRERIEHWIAALALYCQRDSDAEGVRVVDVLYGACDGYANSFICLNASTMGIGGETAARVAAQGNFMRRFSGEARFAAAAVGALAAWRERRVRVSVDEVEVIDDRMNLAAVANGVYAGGGMMLSPNARIDDGKLDVVTAAGFSRAMVIRELPRIHNGGHLANRRVRIMQGEIVKIETFSAADAMLIEVDGNVRGKTPVEFRIFPKALRFVA